MWTAERQTQEHLNCWRTLVQSAKTRWSLSEAKTTQNERRGSLYFTAPDQPHGKVEERWEVHFSSLYLLLLSRSLRRESHPLFSPGHTKCKIFYGKRKVWRTPAAVRSFPMTRSLLAVAWGSQSTFRGILFPVLLYISVPAKNSIPFTLLSTHPFHLLCSLVYAWNPVLVCSPR